MTETFSRNRSAQRGAGGWLAEVGRNLRHAVRVLRARPSFTIAALLTLGLCSGAHTAIFSVVEAVLLRPLPYPHPERLAAVATEVVGDGERFLQDSQDGLTFRVLRDHADRLLWAAASGGTDGVNVVAGGRPQFLHQQRVSADFFQVLGVSPARGRSFTREEDELQQAKVAVLSDGLWRQAFQASPGIVGSTIMLRGEPYTVVGVMPAGFSGNVATDLWTPLRPKQTGEGQGTNYQLFARLKPDVDWQVAAAQVLSLSGSALGKRFGAGVHGSLRLVPLREGLTRELRRPLLILWAAVGLVLVIGCLNVAGLLLAQSSSRRHEVATRLAIGGDRSAVLRQLLTESLLLAVVGTGLGLLFGVVALRALSTFAATGVDLPADLGLDGHVLSLAAGLAVVTTLLFGLLPAWRVSRTDLRSVLSSAGGRGVSGHERGRSRQFLVIVEIALSVLLLVGAGLLLRTLDHLRQLPPGYDSRHVVAAQVSLQDARYATSAKVNALYRKTLERIEALPGVESAAVALGLPYERLLNDGFKSSDITTGAGGDQITDLAYVTPDYFTTLRIPVREGRTFGPRDRADTGPVVIVNEAFARHYFPGREALGRHLETEGGKREIVGVVGDVQQQPGWGAYDPLSAVPACFIPATQTPDGFLQQVHTWFSPQWVIRTRPGAAGIAAGVSAVITSVDPMLPAPRFRSLDEVRSGSVADRRFQAVLLGTLAGLALLLAAVGIYGLIAQSVSDRTRELGLRVALGATLWQAIGAVVVPGVGLALVGVVTGGLGALWGARLLRHMVFGVGTSDPFTFGVVAVVLVGVALAASVVPALRVFRLDPADTLRSN
jgi:predicted permease